MAVELYLTIDLPVTELQRFLPANDAPSVGLPGVYSIILKGLEEDDPEFEFCSERFAIRPRAAVSFRVEKNEYHEDTGFLGYHSALIVVARLLTESTADLVLRDGSTRILLYRAGYVGPEPGCGDVVLASC